MSTRFFRALVAAAIAGGAVNVWAEPAWAHGIGGRADLPLPAWQLAWAAAFAVASSFVVLGAFWDEPKLADAAEGRSLLRTGTATTAVVGVCRVLGLAWFGLILYAAWRGNENGFVNISGIWFFIWFWVGLQIVSAFLGDVWRLFNPFTTVADAAAWIRATVAGRDISEPEHGSGSHWPAVAAIGSFLWFELAYHSPESPRSIGLYLAVYSAVMLGGAAVFGRGWIRSADGFGLLFTKLAAMAPFHVADGAFRLRVPLAGLATMTVVAGTVPFILTVLGGTSFDGFSRSSWWLDVAGDRIGWDRTFIQTVGLVFIILCVGVIYRTAIEVMARITGDGARDLFDAFGPSLVPIAAAYAIAHYFSLLVLDGQTLFIHISDPFGRGSDWFGTVDYQINWTFVSPATIAWVQTLAIAVGHVLAVVAAHDRAIERYDHDLAVRSQYPMLGVMVVYTVIGLFLLLGA